MNSLLVGSNATLLCSADLAMDCTRLRCPDVAITWTFNDRPFPLVPQLVEGSALIEIDDFGRHMSEIQLNDINHLMDGIFMCRVDTHMAHATATMNLAIDARPLAPIRVHASVTGATTVRLSWIVAPADTARVHAYQIQQQSSNDSSWTMLSKGEYA